MKSKPVSMVPAGKRPPVKGSARYKKIIQAMKLWIKAKNIREAHFLLVVSVTLTATLALHGYLGNYVYVVLLDDKEVGMVADAQEVEGFVTDLTNRCGVLYGMRIDPGTKVALVKEFRTGEKPQSESVQTAIRQQMKLVTSAYMIKVDGEPLVSVHSKSDLDEIIKSLKVAYSSNNDSVKLLDAFIVEDLELEPATVNPESIFAADEVVAMLVEDSNEKIFQATSLPDSSGRGSLDSRQSHGYFNSASLVHSISEQELIDHSLAVESNAISIKTIEEVVVTEDIPFLTEIIYDEEMWTVEKEVDPSGKDGKKEIVYHITRTNGVEVDRVRVSERVIDEPVTQIERHGTASVPSFGSGQFIWPVEGGGEITPGRGFSSWHTGIDIHADPGTNILASDSGIVWFSGRGGSQGNYIIIYHGSYWSLYLHNKANLVSEGNRVEQGEVIGRVGSTGRSTGPHLHFEIRLDDGTGEWHGYYQHKPIDPLRFFNP